MNSTTMVQIYSSTKNISTCRGNELAWSQSARVIEGSKGGGDGEGMNDGAEEGSPTNPSHRSEEPNPGGKRYFQVSGSKHISLPIEWILEQIELSMILIG